MNRVRRIYERVTFIPWYIIHTKILKESINLDRLFNCGYCSSAQYKILKKI